MAEAMKRAKFGVGQIALALKQAEDAAKIGEVCRKIWYKVGNAHQKSSGPVHFGRFYKLSS